MTVVRPAKRLAHLAGLNRVPVALVFLGLGALARVRVLERVVAHIRLSFAGVGIVEMAVFAAAFLRMRTCEQERTREENRRSQRNEFAHVS